jgi:enoyl-[acyl-carrier protein] reductase I
VYRASKAQDAQLQTKFEQLQKLGVSFVGFNTDAMNPAKREYTIADLKQKINKGRIKVLLHSIAKGNLKAMRSEDGIELKNDDFHLTLDAMAISLYDWTKDLYRANMFAADARVLSFTSEGSTRAMKNYAAVSAAKAALEAISRSIAMEFAPKGIRANCILAGVTDTASLRMIPGSEALIEHSIKRNPFKRLTQAEEVANVVYLLSKDEASWINGTVITVDGGTHLN